MRPDPFERAGLHLTDEEKQHCIEAVAAYNRAGINVSLEVLITAIASMTYAGAEELSARVQQELNTAS